MPGLLGTNPLYGALYESQPTGLLSQPEPQGLMGALTMNPLMARQVAAQRAANARPNVTDFMGYGPTWQTYLQNMNQNLQAQMMQPGDSGDVMVQKSLGMLGNFGGFGVTAFHGSPHRFSKFDSGKLGTGEGNHVYGRGLYFAESPDVAKHYAGMAGDAGNVYKVDIPDDKVAKMMDWNKPISQQPENVKKAWDKIKQSVDAHPRMWEPFTPKSPEMTGASYYRVLSGRVGEEEAARMMREAGIPGVQYLDQNSRAAGSGTRNFVVFDDGLPKILETSP
jgi:hypothetical protein